VHLSHVLYSMLLKILPFALCTSPLVSTDFAKQIMPILRILCYNGSLDTLTVVILATAKFKPHIFFIVWFRLFLYREHVHSHDLVRPRVVSYVTIDDRSANVSKAPICGLRPHFCYCQTVAGLLMWSALARGRLCRYQLLLALASAVILGSESRGSRDHTLLSQIRDFPFRLLRLAGLRWRYSTPSPQLMVLPRLFGLVI
jgi:hypothetical protein